MKKKIRFGAGCFGIAVVLLAVSLLATPDVARAQGQCGCLDVVFVVDDTGSMAGAIANVKTGLTSIIATAKSASGADSDPNQLRMGLISFADNPQVDQTLTTDVDGALSTAVGALSASGGGGEPEASDESLNLAANGVTACAITNPPWSPLLGEDHPSGSDSCLKIAVLITDATPGGCDSVYADGVDDTNAANVAAAAAGNGVVVSAVLVDNGSVASAAHPGGVEPDVMQGYASATGGNFVTVPSDGTGTANAIADIIENCGGEARLDHYLGYTTRSPRDEPAPTATATLTDQFGEGKYKILGKSITHLNPTEKTKGDEFTPITQPDVHLDAYPLMQLEGSHTPQTVEVTNQFGTITVTTKSPSKLLVPSTKAINGAPPRTLPDSEDLPENRVDHFLCYSLDSFSGFTGLTVGVNDQFDQFRDLDEEETSPFSVLRPIYLCNPAAKLLEGKDPEDTEEIKDPVSHLVCYAGGIKVRRSLEVTIGVNNQIVEANDLESQTLNITREAGVLCVPSTKNFPGGFCGDGVVDEGEECDLGDQNGVPDSGCSSQCTIVEVQTPK